MITCTFEDGGTGLLRHVTVNCLVVRQDHILLGKRAAFLVEGGKWNLLGGFVGRDETTAEAIAREIKEESGWEIENLQLFVINDNPKRGHEDRQNINFVFIANATKQTGRPDVENDLLDWFSLGNLPNEIDFAFDHYQYITLYKKYLEHSFDMPLVGTADPL